MWSAGATRLRGRMPAYHLDTTIGSTLKHGTGAHAFHISTRGLMAMEYCCQSKEEVVAAIDSALLQLITDARYWCLIVQP